MTLAPRLIALSALLVAAVACSDTTNSSSPFSGRWNGSNTVFSSVTVVIQQIGDSLSGTGETTSTGTGDHDGPRPLIGHVYGDSISVEWFPALVTGFSTIRFSGHRSGEALVGSISGDAQITLVKQ